MRKPMENTNKMITTSGVILSFYYLLSSIHF